MEVRKIKILECSTKGDKRFSALCAKVTMFGKTQSVENWYQLSKNFNGKKPKSFKQAKYIQHLGYKPTSFYVNDSEFDIKYLSSWYKILWIKYLDSNPDLVEYAKQFDDFHDVFKNKNTINCQADIIKQYIKEGRRSLINECDEFINTYLKTTFSERL